MKKIISIIIMLTIMISVVPAKVIYAQEKLADLAENEKQLLVNLGIIDKDIVLEGDVTRQSLAKILSVFVAFGQTNPANYTYFVDVPNDNTYANYINLMVENKIMVGVGGGRFAPNDVVTTNQAIKAIVTLLGYNVVADEQGGFPSGYVNQAVKLNVLNGVSVNDSLSFGSLAKLIYNSLNVDVMKKVITGTNEKYEIVKNKTLMSENLKVTKVVGILTATSRSSLSNSITSKGAIRIDDTLYKCAADYTDYYNFIGYSVEAYFDNKTELSEQILKFMLLRPKKNDVLTISSKDFMSFDGKQISYSNENGKKVSVSVDSDLDVLLNGRCIDTYAPNTFDINYGELQLIDNNNDTMYDVVKLNRYETMVVKDIVVGVTKRVFGLYTPSKSIEIDNSTSENVIDITSQDGYPLNFDDIKKNDVLLYSKSLDNHYIKIIVSSTSVSGIVTEIKNEGIKNSTVSIDDVTYRVAPDYYPDFKKEITFPIGGKFLLDSFGYVAGFLASNGYGSNWTYGYLLKAIEDGGLDKRVSTKILSADGRIQFLDIGQNVIIDSVKCKDSSTTLTALNGGVPQILRYYMDEDDMIKGIDTLKQDSGDDSIVVKSDVENLTFKNAINSFEGRISLDSSTLVMVIPADSGAQDDDYAVKDLNYFSNDTAYVVEAYGKENKITADVIIYRVGNVTAINDSNPIAIVSAISSALDKNGEELLKLSAYSEGVKIELYAENNGCLKNIQEGDIIKFAKNSSGNINQVKLMYQQSNPSLGTVQTGKDFSSPTRMVVANVLRKDVERILITDQNPENATFSNTEIHNTTWYKMYLYDSTLPKGRRVSIAKISDVLDYKTVGTGCDKVVAFSYSFWPKGMVFYR